MTMPANGRKGAYRSDPAMFRFGGKPPWRIYRKALVSAAMQPCVAKCELDGFWQKAYQSDRVALSG